MQTKLCPKCEQHLLLDQFHKHKGKGPLGLKSWCKACDNANMAERRKNDLEWAEKRNKKKSEHYYANQDKEREKARVRDSLPKIKLQSKNNRYLRKYGLTKNQVDDMLQNQNNKCEICKKEFGENNRYCVDHDHNTGKVRGILCHPCNVSLGLIKDSIKTAQSMAKYLKAHKGE